MEDIEKQIKSHLNFPKEGINFRDITPLFQQPNNINVLLDEFVKRITESNIKIDAIAGLESRGFLLGLPLALKLNVPFIIIRKAGKLPGNKKQFSYDLEYGSACMEVQVDCVQKDWNVMVHDDLLATGGTANAATQLLLQCGAKIAGYSFIITLDVLNGSQRLQEHSSNIISIFNYSD